jgi:hypothetical protein
MILERLKYRLAWLAAVLIVAALYFWVIGIGAESRRFAWNSDLDTIYGLPSPAVARGISGVYGYYDLLARAFVGGQLHLPVNPQPELLALPNPWEYPTNRPFRLLDAVLYKQRFYLYHGAAPVLLLFAPWYRLTAHDLPENFAAFLFALGGYFFLSLLFLQVLTRLSSRISVALFALCLLAIGIGQSAPYMLHRALLYEVAIACGFCCVSAGFYFLFRWLTVPGTRALWAGLSGLSFGLAIGCRPHLGLAAVAAFLLMLLLPEPGERVEFRILNSQRLRRDILPFCIPVILCCLGIAAYNYARFGNPLEFGLRYQLGESSYQNVRLSMENVAPGLYYLLLCPPNLVAEFPFFRLALRQPFDAMVNVLPPRYFLELTGGIFALSPIALIALLAPFCRKRLAAGRGVFAFVLTMLGFTASCILFLAATGLTSQRYEVDFAPFLLFVACLAACELLGYLGKRTHGLATAALAGLLLYTICANLALAIQGPYDQFVQASPHTYVKLARWFSPLERFRPLENPALRVRASFELPATCAPGKEPLITVGEFGTRYLLSSWCLGDGRVRLFSETSSRSPDWQSVDVPYVAGLNLAGLEFTPDDRTVTVSWNGNVVLRHRLRFLITAPSQIHLGWDPTWGNKDRFPWRIVPSEPPWELRSLQSDKGAR